MEVPNEHDTSDIWTDQRVSYDAMRAQCPVAHTSGAWMILGHAEVVTAATDPETFSSTVSQRRVIPNGLDGEEHAAYRAVIDRYFTPEHVSDQENHCRGTGGEIVQTLPRGETVETITDIGVPYAVRTLSAWLGWPSDLEATLVQWMRDNHAATRSGDRNRTAAVAERFDRIIHTLLEPRRNAPVTDITGDLMHREVDGRTLTDDEIVSILRNFTAGDLGSLAASVGVVVHYLAATPDVQRELRAMVEAGQSAELEAALEEILRIDDPFVSNRRRATREVHIGGKHIPGGGQVVLNWTAANRDPLTFGDPDRYAPRENAGNNVVFGIGPHVCPARGLTLMELRVLVSELLTRTEWVALDPQGPAVRETPPVSGWAHVPILLR